MMITLNCGWRIPGEEISEEENDGLGFNAMFGLNWQPDAPANDNAPEWLDVIC